MHSHHRVYICSSFRKNNFSSWSRDLLWRAMALCQVPCSCSKQKWKSVSVKGYGAVPSAMLNHAIGCYSFIGLTQKAKLKISFSRQQCYVQSKLNISFSRRQCRIQSGVRCPKLLPPIRLGPLPRSAQSGAAKAVLHALASQWARQHVPKIRRIPEPSLTPFHNSTASSTASFFCYLYLPSATLSHLQPKSAAWCQSL